MKVRITFLCCLAVLTGMSVAQADDDPARGEDIAKTHCARCHVIGSFNKHGGIDSTPSFAALLKMPDGDSRFETFFVRRPHPVFVRVPDNPRWSKVPPNATAFPLTLEDISNLLAYVNNLK